VLASASLEHSECRAFEFVVAPDFAVADELARAEARELAEADAEEESLAAYFADAAPPLPAWLSVWPWFSWPAAVVLLFALHRWRVARRQNAAELHKRHVAAKSGCIPSSSSTVATA